jgi:hypothetical protein
MSFLARAETCLLDNGTTDINKIRSLLNAAGTELGLAIQTHISNRIINFHQMMDLLRQEYKMSKPAAVSQYLGASLTPGETFHCFGRRLKLYYMQLVDRPMMDFAANEHYIKHALYVKIILFMPNRISSQVTAHFSANPDMSWNEILTYIDCQHSVHQQQTPSSTTSKSRSSTQANAPRVPYCSNHHSSGHWTKDCRMRQDSGSSNRRGSQPPSGTVAAVTDPHLELSKNGDQM